MEFSSLEIFKKRLHKHLPGMMHTVEKATRQQEMKFLLMVIGQRGIIN